MIAAELLARIPDDDPTYLALVHTLERRLHPAVAAVLAHDELSGGLGARPAHPRKVPPDGLVQDR